MVQMPGGIPVATVGVGSNGSKTPLPVCTDFALADQTWAKKPTRIARSCATDDTRRLRA